MMEGLLRGGLVLLGNGLGVGSINLIVLLRMTISCHIVSESCWSCSCRMLIFWRCQSKSRRHKGASMVLCGYGSKGCELLAITVSVSLASLVVLWMQTPAEASIGSVL